MRPVTVLIFHRLANPDAGPLESALAGARSAAAARQRRAFLAAGADEVRIVEAGPDRSTFGERLRQATAGCDGGVVVLGSGSLLLANARDLRRFVAAAAAPAGAACLANNYFSADAVAVPDMRVLAGAPDLAADNALPRWLEERAGRRVDALRAAWRLSVDLDTPADLLVFDAAGVLPSTLRAAAARVADLSPGLPSRLAAIRLVLGNRRAELLVAGRVSTATLRRLETAAPCRIRALVEERGLRASSPLALGDAAPSRPRPPRSVLGELLDRDGPEALGRVAAKLADGAVVDTRVLLAHRFGADEAAWPPAEERFASDLLLAQSIADPWLRSLTEAARVAPIPILLGGHTTLNAGLRLLARRAP